MDKVSQSVPSFGLTENMMRAEDGEGGEEGVSGTLCEASSRHDGKEEW